MLNLGELELDHALAAIRGHGYGDFFPEPPELALLTTNWAQIRTELARIDLDLYDGYDVTFSALRSRVSMLDG